MNTVLDASEGKPSDLVEWSLVEPDDAMSTSLSTTDSNEEDWDLLDNTEQD
jgi:hypothetical protein